MPVVYELLKGGDGKADEADTPEALRTARSLIVGPHPTNSHQKGEVITNLIPFVETRLKSVRTMSAAFQGQTLTSKNAKTIARGSFPMSS